MARNDKKILYHYTDFQALDGILRSAQLRVNNVLRMNDSAEMRHFMDRLCAAVAQRLEEDGDREGAGQVRQRFREELKKEYSAFAACFSFHRDDAAQWERYGNRGRGVCIAFRREYLEKMATGALSLQMVFYRNDMAGHPMVEEFCRLLKEGADLSGEEVRRAMCEAWACSVSYKHPSFRSEYEMRLVVSPFEKGDFDIRPCYHVTKERIKKYYPLDLRAMCAEIQIGMEELVAELIAYLMEPTDLLPGEAQAMMAGLMLDTKNFTMRTGGRTFEAAAMLRRAGGDTGEVRKLFQTNLSDAVAKYGIIQAAKPYRQDIAIAAVDNTVGRVTAAQAADELLNIAGISASFVLYPDGERVIVSARSIGSVNVQVIVEALGGGGNAAAAGAQIPDRTVEEVRRELTAVLDSYFDSGKEAPKEP